MTIKKTILFFVRLETQFLELLRVYIFLSSLPSLKANLKFLFEDGSPKIINRMSNYCENNNISYDICKIGASPQTISQYQQIKSRLCGRLGGSSAFLNNLFHESNYFICYFSRENVSLLFVGEDGVGTTPSIFYAAKKLNIETITVPYEYSTKKQALDNIIFSDRDKDEFKPHNRITHIIFFLLRKWKTKYEGETYLRLPRLMTLALIFFNYGPKLPWSVNGGYSTKLFCDSYSMKDFYCREGIPRKKIKLIGNLGHDHMHSILKSSKLYWEAYENASLINQSQIRILFSFPPDYTSRQNSIFQKYEELIDYWLMMSKVSSLIVPLYQAHPAVTEEQKKYIESKNIALETDNIVQLIPTIDVLVTSVSSIIRLAIALRKPVMNFDVYHFDYPDYQGVKGVKNINNLEEFNTEFLKIATNQHYIDSLKKEMKPISNHWAMLDGKVGERILSEIHEHLM